MKKFIPRTLQALALVTTLTGAWYMVDTVSKAQQVEQRKTEYALCIGLEKHYQQVGREYIKGTCEKMKP